MAFVRFYFTIKGKIMILSIIICLSTCLLMIFDVLFKPQVKIGKHSVDTYWLIVLCGAILTVVTGRIGLPKLGAALTADTAVNPLKILTLFISMTVLSIFLDEVGFFSYLASVTLKKAGSNQKILFFSLYAIVSVLTVFTSNDIIILTFTPFICYFAKNAKISPVPYLIAEFIAANTWSMALIIGNPTNIYLATSAGIDFIGYLKVMLIPTVAAGIAAMLILLFIFRKSLAQPITASGEVEHIKNKPLLIVGLVHLSVCTVILAVGSYIGIEMWIASLTAAISLTVCAAVISAIQKRKPTELASCLKRAPWQLIPFVLSMFVMILALSESGFTADVTGALGTTDPVFRYGVSSLLCANLINNIPMSVFYSSVIEPLSGITRTDAVFASIVGSNIGAFLTPIGALAGIMWSSILKKQGVKLGYKKFIEYGCAVAIPTAAAALGTLALVV